MQINSENGFQKYANGKKLWPKPIYRQNNGRFSCILVKLVECAAHSPNVLMTQPEISAVSEHVDMNTLEKYKKLTHLTQAADRHKAGLILAPSGRQLLRGKDNQFGQVGSSEDSIYSEFQDAKLKKRSPVSTVKASPTD